MKRDIAIIGMAGRFPEADNIGQFFQNLKNGRDSVRPISEDRKRNTTVPADQSYDEFAWLDNIHMFDHQFFKIAPAEARCMDPRQRLLLEVVYEMFENAGYDVDHFSGSDTAIFTADTQLDYYQHATAYDPTLHTGNLNAATAGRIARFFNLRGTAEMIDTACSSALTALHHACNTLILGDAEHAIVCGAKLFLLPPHQTADGAGLGIRSPEGRSRTFAAGANGIGLGEGVAALLLKPLEQALKDKDTIHAVIKSVAVNQDGGLSASLTAPDSIAQAEVILKAWEKAGVHPETIGYIEAHGTGTKLGDPIEIDGIDIAFKKHTDARHICAVSSVKTNIGHTDNVAGLAGIIKAVLSLKHGLLFPSLHFDQPNPFIDFSQVAVYVNDQLKVWESAQHRRRAGVSGFGLIGTNVHTVLEEAPEQPERPDTAMPQLFLISAATEISLQANITALQAWMADSNIHFNDTAFTLAAGRKHYPYRFACIADTPDALLAQLQPPVQLTNVVPASLYFIFSGEINITAAIIDQYSAAYEVFRQYASLCAAYQAASPGYFAFVFQYAFYHLLRSKGVQSDTLIGNGIGKIVVSVLKGTTTLPQGVQEAIAFVAPPATDIAERAQQLVERETSGTRVVFAEMGPAGNISKALQVLSETDTRFEAVTLDPAQEYPLLAYVKALYLSNVPINWEMFYSGQPVQRTTLPAYRFNRKHCWIKEPAATDVSKWLYELKWIPDTGAHQRTPFTGRTLLIMAGESSGTKQVVQQLTVAGNHCIVVTPAAAFGQQGDNEYTINPAAADDYRLLWDALKGITLHGIIHLGNCRTAADITITEHLHEGLYAQFLLTRHFRTYLSQPGFLLCFVSIDANRVLPEEKVHAPAGAASAAYLKGMLSQYPGLRVSQLDMAATAQEIPLLTELCIDDLPRFVSYRNGQRYIQQLMPCAAAAPINFSDGQVYLITGGASGIGLEMARSIAAKARVHLVLTGRRGQQEDFAQLTAGGSTVKYMRADVTDENQMQAVIAHIKNNYGHLTGIIHAAGIGINGLGLEEATIETFTTTLLPKVQGTLQLAAVCRELRPSFMVLCSSLNALVPQRNSADYAAANAFLDAFAQMGDPNIGRVLSIAWPGWSETGMSFRKGIRSAGNIPYINTHDGISAFHMALATDCAHVLVTSADLRTFAVNPFFVLPGKAPAAIPAPSLPVPAQEMLSTTATIINIWKEVLQVDELSDTDDFFELGGHSLNGTQVISRMEKAFGLELDFDLIYDHATAAAFAGYIDGLRQTAEQPLFKGIPPVEQQSHYAVSEAQHRLWLFEQVEKNSPVYVMPGTFRITGPLHVPALSKAFHALVNRHEILRTTFIFENGELRQRIHAPGTDKFRFEEADLSQAENPAQEAGALVERNAAAPFDLQQGPLLRVTLIKTAEAEYLLLFAMHHIISDSWSLDVLLHEVLTMYRAFSAGAENPLPPLQVHYKDYVAWRNARLTPEKISEHRRFWMEYLRGPLPVLALPADFERPSQQAFSGGNVNIVLDSGTTSLLTSLAQTYNTTLFNCLLAAYNALLYRTTGQTDILLGTPVADRKHSDLEYQIGFYINTVVLRTHVKENDTFAGLLERTRDNTLQAFQYDSYSFDEIVKDLSYERIPGRSVLIDAGFSWNREKSDREVHVDFTIEKQESGLKVARYDLWLYGSEMNGQILLILEYNTALFRTATIGLLAERLASLLRQVAANPQLPLSDIETGTPGPAISTGNIDDEFNFTFKQQ
jgi:acyl transferase domain-containing protein/acyl carrier protein